MYAMRGFSVRHSRWLKAMYGVFESTLVAMDPFLRRVGYNRIDRSFVVFEKMTKGFLLDSQSCGQCVVGSTGMSCPMNCPKELRNGPCGGVRMDGKCEVEPTMDCVWVQAWEGNKRMRAREYPIQFVQPALDNRLRGRSAWLREVRKRVAEREAQA